MKTKQNWIISGLIAVGIVLALLILNLEAPIVADEQSEVQEEKTDTDVGPHGGQLFVKGDFGLEILLAEEDQGEPHFRLYLFNQDKILPPNANNVSIIVTRPDGEKQNIGFVAEKDFLQSIQTIEEPHVFEATVTAHNDSQTFQFSWVKEEGKIKLTDQQIKETGVTTQTANTAHIRSIVTLPGEIRFNEDKTSHVVPRLAGVVEAISANLGDPVKKGQVLVVIASTGLAEQRSELLSAQKRLELARSTYAREKRLWEAKISAEQDYLQAQQVMNEAEIAVHNAQQKLLALGASPNVSVNSGSLNRYEIRAPFDGMIVEKHIALGEAVKEDASIFTISDLSSVWAEIIVSAKDLNVIRVGGKVTIKATALDSTASGTVSYVGALMGEQTRTAKARVTLENPQMAWRPGLFITVEVVAKETEVPVAVPSDAIQTINDKPAIFIRVPGGFIAQPITTGLSDGKATEIVTGLKPGTEYAVNGSFVLKSEQGKEGASHEH
jgi:cobalt-zinc-cadmium efflux system membrane fusion protein